MAKVDILDNGKGILLMVDDNISITFKGIDTYKAITEFQKMEKSKKDFDVKDILKFINSDKSEIEIKNSKIPLNEETNNMTYGLFMQFIKVLSDSKRGYKQLTANISEVEVKTTDNGKNFYFYISEYAQIHISDKIIPKMPKDVTNMELIKTISCVKSIAFGLEHFELFPDITRNINAMLKDFVEIYN